MKWKRVNDKNRIAKGNRSRGLGPSDKHSLAFAKAMKQHYIDKYGVDVVEKAIPTTRNYKIYFTYNECYATAERFFTIQSAVNEALRYDNPFEIRNLDDEIILKWDHNQGVYYRNPTLCPDSIKV